MVNIIPLFNSANTMYFCYPTLRNRRSHGHRINHRNLTRNIDIAALCSNLAFIHATKYINIFYIKLKTFSKKLLYKVRAYILT